MEKTAANATAATATHRKKNAKKPQWFSGVSRTRLPIRKMSGGGAFVALMPGTVPRVGGSAASAVLISGCFNAACPSFETGL